MTCPRPERAHLRPVGWRVSAWVAGLLSALLGTTSLLNPDATSSLDVGWALAAIAWGVAFIALAARTADTESPAVRSSHEAPSEPALAQL